MSALGTKLRQLSAGAIALRCPGCNQSHVISVNSGVPGRDWTFNGDGNKPTFAPSVLVRTGHHMPGHAGKPCWCTYAAEHPSDPDPFVCTVCHSFVRDGMIEFLSDCTHALAGQTVELPDFEAP